MAGLSSKKRKDIKDMIVKAIRGIKGIKVEDDDIPEQLAKFILEKLEKDFKIISTKSGMMEYTD